MLQAVVAGELLPWTVSVAGESLVETVAEPGDVETKAWDGEGLLTERVLPCEISFVLIIMFFILPGCASSQGSDAKTLTLENCSAWVFSCVQTVFPFMMAVKIIFLSTSSCDMVILLQVFSGGRSGTDCQNLLMCPLMAEAIVIPKDLWYKIIGVLSPYSP